MVSKNKYSDNILWRKIYHAYLQTLKIVENEKVQKSVLLIFLTRFNIRPKRQNLFADEKASPFLTMTQAGNLGEKHALFVLFHFIDCNFEIKTKMHYCGSQK